MGLKVVHRIRHQKKTKKTPLRNPHHIRNKIWMFSVSMLHRIFSNLNFLSFSRWVALWLLTVALQSLLTLEKGTKNSDLQLNKLPPKFIWPYIPWKLYMSPRYIVSGFWGWWLFYPWSFCYSIFGLFCYSIFGLFWTKWLYKKFDWMHLRKKGWEGGGLVAIGSFFTLKRRIRTFNF